MTRAKPRIAAFISLLAAGVLCVAPVQAAALEARVTDDSVCDFGNPTYDLVNHKLLDGKHGPTWKFQRAMYKWMVDNCANGQTLLIGDDENQWLSDEWMGEVQMSACAAADVSRQAIGKRGYRMRCSISKLDQLKAKYGGGGGGK